MRDPLLGLFSNLPDANPDHKFKSFFKQSYDEWTLVISKFNTAIDIVSFHFYWINLKKKLIFQEEKCEDKTQGYSTSTECTTWPVVKCSEVRKVNNKKYTPHTTCKKEPRQLCGPSGCVPEPGPEECFDKKETVVQEVCSICLHENLGQNWSYWGILFRGHP